MTIRPYTADDYPLISSWWIAHKEVAPLPSMLPLESTWILETDEGVPHYTVSLILTNTSEYCYVENFCRNPCLAPNNSAPANLLEYIEKFAKLHGHKRLFCLAHTEPTKRRYEALGFTKVLEGLASFCRVME